MSPWHVTPLRSRSHPCPKFGRMPRSKRRCWPRVARVGSLHLLGSERRTARRLTLLAYRAIVPNVRYSMKGASMDYLTVTEVATRLRVADKTVRRWCASGQLRAIRAGKPWRITPADLDAFLRRKLEGSENEQNEGIAGLAAMPPIGATLQVAPAA